MSGVGSSTISGTPSPFFSFSDAVAFGRKSATAAAITTTSQSANRLMHRVVHLLGGLDPDDVDVRIARRRCAVVTSVTAAPRRDAASARA